MLLRIDGGPRLTTGTQPECFVAGTLVITGIAEDGSYITKAIEQLAAGDLVLSRDQSSESDDVGQHAVVQVFRKMTDHLRIVQIRDANGNIETIRTTDEHPFYVAGLGWVAAKDLREGDRLNEADDSNDSTVLSSIREEHPDGVAVYNFEVEGDHTYFVEDGFGAATAVWVHNYCGPGQWNHFVPRMMGSEVPHGSQLLKQSGGKLPRKEHVAFHKGLADFLESKGISRAIQNMEDMTSQFTKYERIGMLTEFYTDFNKGKYLGRYLVELGDTLSRGLMK